MNKRANLSEFRDDLEKMSEFDMKIGLIEAENYLNELFNKEDYAGEKHRIATAIYSIRHANINLN